MYTDDSDQIISEKVKMNPQKKKGMISMAKKQLLHGKVLTILLTALFAFHFSLLTSHAQTVRDLIRKYPSYASCNYHIYPEITATLTPPPGDKKPFYLSHYGRHGSRYINSRSGYDIPYKMMAQASLVKKCTLKCVGLCVTRKIVGVSSLVMANDSWRLSVAAWRSASQRYSVQELGLPPLAPSCPVVLSRWVLPRYSCCRCAPS